MITAPHADQVAVVKFDASRRAMSSSVTFKLGKLHLGLLNIATGPNSLGLVVEGATTSLELRWWRR